MLEFGRRTVFFGGLLTLISMDRPCCAFVGQSAGTGCYVPPEAAPTLFGRTSTANLYETGTEDIEPNSGDPRLDRALAQSLAKLARTWDVLPGFAYFREPKENNALATPRVLLKRGDGTVLFGLGMLKELLTLPEHRDAAIVSVCAHEFAHVVQYKSGFFQTAGTLTTRGPISQLNYVPETGTGFYAGSRRPLSIRTIPQWYSPRPKACMVRGRAVPTGRQKNVATQYRRGSKPHSTGGCRRRISSGFNFAMSR